MIIMISGKELQPPKGGETLDTLINIRKKLMTEQIKSKPAVKRKPKVKK